MKQVSAHLPKVMDLHDETSVLYYAKQIHAAVNSGSRPIGEPRWTPKMVSDFFERWHSRDPKAQPVGHW